MYNNTIVIEGHLGKDAAMKNVESVGHITEFSVAVSYGKGGKKTSWFNVTAWHGVAKGCEHLRKGDAVTVKGWMRDDPWTDKNDTKRHSWSLQAESVGKLLYVKDEPGVGKDTDYHQPDNVDTEPVNDTIPF